MDGRELMIGNSMGGLPVYCIASLPVDATCEACNIATKEIEQYLTGEQVHAFKMGNAMYVSPKLYSELMNEVPEQAYGR